MSERQRKSGAAFFEGLLLGTVIGGALALLFAPQSGEETRTWLKKIKDDNQDVIDDALINGETAVAAAKRKIEDSFKSVSRMVDTHDVRKK